LLISRYIECTSEPQYLIDILLAEAQLSTAIEELKATNLDLTRRCESLEESFNKEKSEKLVRGDLVWLLCGNFYISV
jgi:hypothetical protein